LAFIVVTVVFFLKPFCDNCRNDVHFADKVQSFVLLGLKVWSAFN
jgi:hypothetical protein